LGSRLELTLVGEPVGVFGLEVTDGLTLVVNEPGGALQTTGLTLVGEAGGAATTAAWTSLGTTTTSSTTTTGGAPAQQPRQLKV
jgi:hypothetical protein